MMNPARLGCWRLRQFRCGWMRLWVAVGAALLGTGALRGAEPTVTTYPFKTFDSSTNQLKVDVHRPAGNLDGVRPVIVFIHGGALMMGDRSLKATAGSLLETLLAAGYVVVSID